MHKHFQGEQDRYKLSTVLIGIFATNACVAKYHDIV